MAVAITDIGSATDGGGSAVAVTVPGGGVPAGSVIWVAIVEINGTGVAGTVADTAGNSYAVAFGDFLGGNQANGLMWVFFAKNSAALNSGNTITYTKNTSGSDTCILASYITGALTTTPRDTAVDNITSSGTSNAPSVTSGTPAVSKEMFIAVVANNITEAITLDSGHGWAAPPASQSGGASAIRGGSQVNAGVGTKIYAPTWTTSAPWALSITGFKPAPEPGVGRTPPGVFRRPQGPTHGLTPTRAFPPFLIDPQFPQGRIPPRIFRPKQGPTHGLRPTRNFQPPPPIVQRLFLPNPMTGLGVGGAFFADPLSIEREDDDEV